MNPFKKVKSLSKLHGKPVDAVIGANIEIKDNSITGEGLVEINGRFFGNINLAGSLSVGEQGYIQGNIEAYNIEVNGRVDGDITVSGSLTVLSKGIIKGNLTSPSIVVAEGGQLNGQVNTRCGGD